MLTEFRIGQLEEMVKNMLWRIETLEMNESNLKETIKKLKKGINPLTGDETAGLRERIERLEEKIDRVIQNNSELEDRINISVGDLTFGECFELNGKVWMKIEPLNGLCEYLDQVVCLENGRISSFLKSWKVKSVEKGNFD